MGKSTDKSNVSCSSGHGAEQTEERVHESRREALIRLGTYTAPAMLAMLLPGVAGAATHSFTPI
jgi:hypothetical protein